MAQSFLEQINTRLEHFFMDYHFVFEELKTADQTNQLEIYYKSPACKICFYRSAQDGELNCLLASSDSTNNASQSNGWQYLNSLLHDKNNPTIEDLLSLVPNQPKSEDQQMDEIVEKLIVNFTNIKQKL